MMRRTRRCSRAWLLSACLLLVLPVLALADWVPADGHKMHFPQMPDESGWNVKAMNPVMLADDWQCSETGWVKDFHFWGSWKGGLVGNISKFNVVIFEDIPAAPPNIPYSRPGKVLWRHAITNFIPKPITGATMEGWYDPSTGLILPNDHQTYFQYNIFLPQTQWFHQDVGKIYWLGISADVQGPLPLVTEWGWKSTKNHFNDDAVWGTIPSGLTCVAQDNGSGTASQPALCPYTPDSDVMRVLNGLPPGTSIECQTELVMLSLTSETPGGSLGGTTSTSEMRLKWHMTGTGALSGYSRDVMIPLPNTMTDQGPRSPGTSPQSFDTDMHQLHGQLPIGDPDFDLLRITAGSGFGMPSPGHTTLTQMGGPWAVESFFDIFYEIDFVGRPGGPLSGMSGSTTATIRMGQGTAPTTSWVELHEPAVTLPPIHNDFNVVVDPNGQFAGGSGTDAYPPGWYTYPSQWINIWFYDHPYDITRYKKIHFEFDLIPFQPALPSVIEVAVNWSTDLWSVQGNPPADPRVPPLPGTDEALYIGRTILHQGTTPTGHYIFDYVIPDYNPEWVSVDVRGRNYITSGRITHECLPKNPPPSMDLSFVITGGNVTLGACCVPNATGTTCQQLTAAACQSAGGAYLGDGTSCTPNPCSNPIGACCKPDGTCALTTAFDCHAIGGMYQGDGTSCTGVNCPPTPTGACCIPGALCQIMTKADCANAGGTYFGDGSTCTPDPCHDVLGACCLPSGACVNTTALACISHNGSWQGANTDCATIVCPPAKEGACCLPTGGCVIATPALCAQQGGVYKGDGTPCTPNICLEPVGACCLPNGACVQTTKDHCISLNGIFFGIGTPCSPTLCGGGHQLGACCLPDGTCVSPVTAEECKLKHGIFLGVGSICTPGIICNPPASGACCLPNGNCISVTKDSCVVRHGTYYGDGSPCVSGLCPPQENGACCLPNGTCIQTTENKCKIQHGVWNGWGSSCAVIHCPPPPEKGACCLPNGTCAIMLVADCKLAHGAFQGNGTSCSPNPCGKPKGACCLPTGGCIVTTVADCQKLHGAYKGDGTPCLPNTCKPQTEVGACCLRTGGCIVTTPAVCSAVGGAFKGLGTVCSATTCPQISPTGACYLPDGNCIQTSQEACYGANGAYQGDGTACTIALRGAACCIGLTGNVDADAADAVDISDVFALVDYLGASVPPNPCFEEDDADLNGSIDISDLFALIDHLTGAMLLPNCP